MSDIRLPRKESWDRRYYYKPRFQPEFRFYEDRIKPFFLEKMRYVSSSSEKEIASRIHFRGFPFDMNERIYWKLHLRKAALSTIQWISAVSRIALRRPLNVELSETKRNRRSIISLDLHKFYRCSVLILFVLTRAEHTVRIIVVEDITHNAKIMNYSQ